MKLNFSSDLITVKEFFNLIFLCKSNENNIKNEFHLI